MTLKISPLAPKASPQLPPIAGIRMVGIAAGIRYSGRKDLLFMECVEGTSIAGVFTKSLTAAAPIVRSKQHLAGGMARGLIVNSGNANAFTGELGEKAVDHTLNAAARLLNCEPEECFVASTGVIGEPLAFDKILETLPEAYGKLQADGWQGAAEAIMTTDTFPKLATRTAKIGGKTVTLNGIAKGSGMIAPDMATMLGFIATDAAISQDNLQKMLRETTETSFNAITVDSDTSTSDMVLLFATAQAKNAEDADLTEFKAALQSIMLELAQLIVKDGEGATKFCTVKVTGAENNNAAKTVAMAIANSPLIKTAIAGEDPNWGRVVMAVGKAGEKAERDRLKIWFGEFLLAEKGQRVEGYDEAPVAAYMKNDHVEIAVDLSVGDGAFTVYSCDLTDGYIRINADYRS